MWPILLTSHPFSITLLLCYRGGAVSDPREGWERLAALLINRRVELSPQYRNRQKFAADTGLNERLISDLENSRRTSYRSTSLRAVERAYRWQPGSIDRALAGDAPIGLQAGAAVESDARTPALVAPEPSGASRSAHQLLDELRVKAKAENRSLAEVLVHEGLAEPEELTIPDHLPPDPIIEEINASNLSQELKERLIHIHLENRKRIFEEARLARKNRTVE